MTRGEALGILREAQWTYRERLNARMPAPAALTDSPAINEEILLAAGVPADAIGVFEGATSVPIADDYGMEDDDPDEELAPETRHLVIGKTALAYLERNGVDIGRKNRTLETGLPDEGESWLGI